MSVRARVLAALRRVGSAAQLREEDGSLTPFTASIQPQRAHRGEEAGPLGVGTGRRATLYAPAGSAADRLVPGRVLIQNGVCYRVLAAETLSVGGEPLYRWGILEPQEEEEAPT